MEAERGNCREMMEGGRKRREKEEERGESSSVLSEQPSLCRRKKMAEVQREPGGSSWPQSWRQHQKHQAVNELFVWLRPLLDILLSNTQQLHRQHREEPRENHANFISIIIISATVWNIILLTITIIFIITSVDKYSSRAEKIEKGGVHQRSVENEKPNKNRVDRHAEKMSAALLAADV